MLDASGWMMWRGEHWVSAGAQTPEAYFCTTHYGRNNELNKEKLETIRELLEVNTYFRYKHAPLS